MRFSPSRLRRLGHAALTVGLLATATPTLAAPKRVAVLEFQASWSGTCGGQKALRGDDAERCEFLGLLADEARAGTLEVLKPPSHVVMTRENTAQLLKEMGSKPACTEGECEVETARLVGADLVLSGQVSRLGGAWIVSVKLHDVKTAALLGARSASGATTLEALDALKREVELMVQEVAGPRASADRASPGATTAKPAMVEIGGGMARLPGGTYTMGESWNGVTVKPFLLDVTEVTVGAYRACVKTGKCRAVDGGKDANHPVVNVD